jgi:hypothetical protein
MWMMMRNSVVLPVMGVMTVIAGALDTPQSETVPSVADREPWRAPITFERAYYEEAVEPREWREIDRYAHYPVTQEQAEFAQTRLDDRPEADAGAKPSEPAAPAGL